MAAMGVGSGAQDLVVAGGVESMSRWDVAVGSLDDRRRQPGLPGAVPDGAPGDLGRPDRHAREDSAARTSTRSRSRASAAPPWPSMRAGSTARWSPVADADGSRRAGPRRASPPRTPRSRGWPSCGRPSPRWAPHAADGDDRTFDEICLERYPDDRPHRARAPRRQLLGRRRRCGGRGRRVRRRGCGPTASRPEPASGPRPRSAPNPSSC